MAVTEISARKRRSKGTFIRNNSLSLVCFTLFAIFVVGQFFTGFRDHNDDQKAHNQRELSLGEYVTSGAFWESLSENWESEYLQMASYVILTVFLIQKGSSESKDPEKDSHDVDRDPERADKRRNVPWPVRRGGLWLRLYENSLFLVFHCSSSPRWSSTRSAAHARSARSRRPTASLL